MAQHSGESVGKMSSGELIFRIRQEMGKSYNKVIETVITDAERAVEEARETGAPANKDDLRIASAVNKGGKEIIAAATRATIIAAQQRARALGKANS